MHAEEVDTAAALVQQLLSAQFPQRAGLPIEPVGSYGTDHDIYGMGGPRGPHAADRVGEETGGQGGGVAAEAGSVATARNPGAVCSSPTIVFRQSSTSAV
jgi:hypothetical protein